MTDRPTLWVSEVLDGEHDGVIYVNHMRVRLASRADLLAVLDKEWYCMSGHHTVRRCTQTDPHEGFGCHWAVKP